MISGPEEILGERECENIGEKELELETIFESRDDAFNLNVSLAILETETDEVVSLPELHQSV